MKPVRITLSRRKGFRLQEISRALNGLQAVNVARPSKWGNPFTIEQCGSTHDAVETFKATHQKDGPFIAMVQAELRGKNLACWCKGSPCHADVLLELANR